jgi:predicted Zn-dependent peptidase
LEVFVSAAPIAQSVFDNGLRARVDPLPHRRIVHLGIFFRHGAEFETRDTNGLAHYVEHVLLNPRNMPSEAGRLYDRLTDAGMGYEAFTSKEYTRMVMTCLPGQVDATLELMARILENPEVTRDAVEHERPIILQEHAMSFASSRIIFNEGLDNSIWGDSSLGLFVIGRRENIARFDRAEIEERIRSFYTPDRSLLIAIGPVEPERFFASAGRAFSGWRSPGQEMLLPPLVTEPHLLALPQSGNRVDLLMGYPSVGFASSDRFALELLADILGAGFKSRLFAELRERRKLAYLVHAYTVNYVRGGYLGIRVNCDRADAGSLPALIEEQLAAVRDEGVLAAELERVTAGRAMEVLAAVEDHARYLQFLGRRSLLGGEFNADEEIENLRRVTPADVQRVAQKTLDPDNVAIVGLGMSQAELDQIF